MITVEYEFIVSITAQTAMAKHMRIEDDLSDALMDKISLVTAKLEALSA